MLNTLVDFGRDVEPELYKRYLAIVLDGLAPARRPLAAARRCARGSAGSRTLWRMEALRLRAGPDLLDRPGVAVGVAEEDVPEAFPASAPSVTMSPSSTPRPVQQLVRGVHVIHDELEPLDRAGLHRPAIRSR